MIYVVYVVEESTGYECFAALIKGRQRIGEISSSRKREGYHLEWEEVSLFAPELLSMPEGSMVHLVFLGRLMPENGMQFVFPGQSLYRAMADEEVARQELTRERAIHGADFVHLWSVPRGWETPDLHDFLGSAECKG